MHHRERRNGFQGTGVGIGRRAWAAARQRLYRRLRRRTLCGTRRSVLDSVGYFDPDRRGIASDVDMWLRIAERFPLAILDEPLDRYRKSRHQWTTRYRRLRTEPDIFFGAIDNFLAREHTRARLSPEDLTEYAFQRCDDTTYRAANWVVKGDADAAWRLLRETRYPWRTLRAGGGRRKLRLLALRALIIAGLTVGACPALARILQRIGP